MRAVAVLACVLALGPLTSDAAERNGGERSWTRPARALQWQAPLAPPATVVAYPEISVRAIFEVSVRNAKSGSSVQQLGIGRDAEREGVSATPPPLRWTRLADGGWVSRMEFRSPLALALRVGLRPELLDPRVQLRFAGSDRPETVIASVTGAQARHLADAKGMYWTPSTDGESQIIEIYRPLGVGPRGARMISPMLSHLLGNSRNNFILAKSLGQAAKCQLDVACKASTLGPHFLDAAASTFLMQYVDSHDGQTYGCTGTLIADKVPSSQIPYAVTGSSCLVAELAPTVNTFWNLEAPSCGSGTSRAPIQLTGGVEMMFGTGLGDVAGASMLLRLNEPAPPGAFFAGWDAGPIPQASPVVGIHHPMGDVKKAVTGQFRNTHTYTHKVSWIGGGYMEGRSWGSGLFTPGADGYRLRGTARNGLLSCANTFTITQPGNYQIYGRFDLFHPYIRHFMDPTEVEAVDFHYSLAGTTVTFLNTTVEDRGNITSTRWLFGDGTAEYGSNASHTYPAPDRYTVTMIVSYYGGVEKRVTRVVSLLPVRVNGAQPMLPPHASTSASPTRPSQSAAAGAGPRRHRSDPADGVTSPISVRFVPR